MEYELEVVGEDDGDWDVAMETEVDIEEIEDEESVVGLDVASSCSCTELLEERLTNTRFVPSSAPSAKDQHQASILCNGGPNILNGLAATAQHRMVAHTRGCREYTMTSIYIGHTFFSSGRWTWTELE